MFESATAVSVNGTTLACVESGRGDPIVFVHGAISDLRTWSHQVSEFSTTHRAISLSRRYARPNEPVRRGAGDPWMTHADDLAAFLKGVVAAPAHLVGNSSGAFIALLTALAHPGLVRSLTLEEPPVVSLYVSTPPKPLELLSLLATHPRTALGIMSFGRIVQQVQRSVAAGDEEAALRAFAGAALSGRGLDDLPPERQQQVRDNWAPLREFLTGDDSFPPLSKRDLRALGVPVLLVTGVRSPAWLLRLTDRLEELVPNVSRVEIEDASHLMHEENPQSTNRAIRDFLARAT